MKFYRLERERRQRLIWEFFECFDLFSPKDRMEVLVKLAAAKFTVNSKPFRVGLAARRSKFEFIKPRRFIGLGSCRVCGSAADVRHHVIQLQNGGTNGEQNIVNLCNTCHWKIHPWMKKRA